LANVAGGEADSVCHGGRTAQIADEVRKGVHVTRRYTPYRRASTPMVTTRPLQCRP
jgi:hypothetical protein